MANFKEDAAQEYDWESGGVYVIEPSDPVEGGPEGISNRQGRELALRTRNLHERLDGLKQETADNAADLAKSIDAKTEAALRGAKEYTDSREVAILAAADTKDESMLRTAKEYADRIVAALAGSAPETLDTLQELAAALGNDPNFSATVMQMIGERVTTEALAAALAGKADTNGNVSEEFYASRLFFDKDKVKGVVGGDYSSALAPDDVYLCNWRHDKGAAGLISKEDPYFLRVGEWIKRTIWHSGNFDPNTVRRNKSGDFPVDKITSWNDDLLQHSAIYRVDGWRSDGNYGAGIYDKPGAPPMLHLSGQGILIVDEAGGYTFESTQRMVFANGIECVRVFYNSVWSSWKTIYSTGNLGPATASANGLMSAADKQKLDSIGLTMKLLGAGVVSAAGGFEKKKGSITSLEKVRTGYYRIHHSIGHTSYEVMATGIVSNNNRGYPVLTVRTSGYFDIRTADDSSDNDAGFFFQVYEF